MTYRVKVYPHNDLLNLAHFQRETIRKKLADENLDGIKLDCLSCLVSLAFSVEALVNFVGYKKIPKWKEFDRYKNKITKVCAKAGVEFDKSVGLYEKLWQLKELRDHVAHGEPIEIETDVTTREELREQMSCPWDSCLTPEIVETMFRTVKEFEKLLFTNCHINVGETLTSAVRVG
ncbi:hypothetical protein [Vibrio gazogenes]|uniref:RiboL-PSP-HEPN domain-containing protein n=1 Tax=Vibrio gazogenes DSM 21264 = NBRC 103151 TaxID=1123492 RepID=A0A1M5GVW7_VIBGA|nr:hypothetical protein [Vibrio gazogenes]USP15806.1 hypothetical protein MKS89_20710 [Vibrio gazogenes]SHG07896.1 hypothetical protein SAMN02745781_03913 [Vibrio gazogenes DSM 21264] [Vibrio gazogenes DSM 21264 = NBRC 103151]SJN56823.1 hypothetical protein BQ6471_02231 [Vibrio gazogenes]